MLNLETKTIFGNPEDSYFLTFSKVVTACLGIKPDCSYKVLMYACAKCDNCQTLRMDEMFRKECMEKMNISYPTYEKARKALIKANILKPQVKHITPEGKKAYYKGVYRINEAIAWKGTAMSRKQLFKEGLVAKITVEAVPVSECRKLE